MVSATMTVSVAMATAVMLGATLATLTVPALSADAAAGRDPLSSGSP